MVILNRKYLFLLIGLLLLVVLPILAYSVVAYKASNRIYDDVTSVPYNEVGMVPANGKR